MDKTLRTVSDIRRFFHRNERPIYFISATNFNLLGIDEWVRNFKYVSYLDCYDGRHPNVFVPNEAPHAEFEVQARRFRLANGEPNQRRVLLEIGRIGHVGLDVLQRLALGLEIHVDEQV